MVGLNGTSVVRVLLSGAVSSGEVFQPMHWSSPFASQPNANAASTGIVDKVSGQPALKSNRVTIRRFAAKWHGFGVAIQNRSLSFDYWATRPLLLGHSFECAGLELPNDWNDVLQRFIDLADPAIKISRVASSSGTIMRCVATRDGTLEFALFVSQEPVQASRQWLQLQLGRPVNALLVLAGRPPVGAADFGPIVCACNNIGRFQITSSISQMPNANLNAICEATRAGTGCGSCRPEIQKIMNETPSFAEAAE